MSISAQPQLMPTSLAELASEGMAVLDRERRFLYLNPAGERILGVEAERLVGQPALVFEPEAGAAGSAPGGTVRAPGSEGERLIEFEEREVEGHLLVVFRDTTDSNRRDRQLEAFTETATALVRERTPAELLDETAAALREATGTVACTVVLFDPASERIEQVGTAGDYPTDYAERLEACRRRGAPLASLAAFRSGEPFVSHEWGSRVVADPRWAPLHSVVDPRRWRALAAAPLRSREGVIGALTAFYPTGRLPDDADISFLTAIAAQVAVAVRNHHLMIELRDQAALDERIRLSRELHDSVSQALFSLNLRVRAVSLANRGEEPERRERVAAGLEEVADLTTHALAQMRSLILHLRPDELGGGGVVAAIRRHAEAVASREELELEVEGPAQLSELSPSAEAEVFRIAQEALNNVVRHASAEHAKVRLEAGPAGALELSVVDDGRGFDPEAEHRGRLGLRGMRERCEGLGGSLTVESRPGRTEVRARIG